MIYQYKTRLQHLEDLLAQTNIDLQILTSSVKSLIEEAITLNEVMKEHERKLKGIN